MLNRAHFLHRQAEKAARKGNVEEAIQLHKEAADILRDLLQTVINEKVAESLRLQAELHEKEQLVLNNQKRRAIKVYKNLEKIRVGMNKDNKVSAKSSVAGSPVTRVGSRTNGNTDDSDFTHYYFNQQTPSRAPKSGGSSGDSLQVSIYRKFEETESLLDQLRIHDDSSEQWRGGGGLSSNVSTPRRHLQTFSASPLPITPSSDINTATKRPKDDKVIIEELQIANSHLRKMVDSLFLELNQCQRDNRHLKDRLRHLEGQLRERNEEQDEPMHTCGMQRGCHSSHGSRTTLPGSTNALKPDLPGLELPTLELPALDMPVFDYEK